MLDELNHRVKNNMMMLKSLLAVAARTSKSLEARGVLDEASKRVAAMAAAQRVLYDTPDAVKFGAGAFLGAVCETAKQMFPAAVHLVCEADPIQLPNDVAMPLALIINELVTNAVKYGLPANGHGTIRVSIKQDGQTIGLVIEDEGPGFELSSVRSSSSGLRLVEGLVRQIGGTFDVGRHPSRCSVTFSQESEDSGLASKSSDT